MVIKQIMKIIKLTVNVINVINKINITPYHKTILLLIRKDGKLLTYHLYETFILLSLIQF